MILNLLFLLILVTILKILLVLGDNGGENWRTSYYGNNNRLVRFYKAHQNLNQNKIQRSDRIKNAQDCVEELKYSQDEEPEFGENVFYKSNKNPQKLTNCPQVENLRQITVLHQAPKWNANNNNGEYRATESNFPDYDNFGTKINFSNQESTTFRNFRPSQNYPTTFRSNYFTYGQSFGNRRTTTESNYIWPGQGNQNFVTTKKYENFDEDKQGQNYVTTRKYNFEQDAKDNKNFFTTKIYENFDQNGQDTKNFATTRKQDKFDQGQNNDDFLTTKKYNYNEQGQNYQTQSTTRKYNNFPTELSTIRTAYYRPTPPEKDEKLPTTTKADFFHYEVDITTPKEKYTTKVYQSSEKWPKDKDDKNYEKDEKYDKKEEEIEISTIKYYGNEGKAKDKNHPHRTHPPETKTTLPPITNNNDKNGGQNNGDFSFGDESDYGDSIGPDAGAQISSNGNKLKNHIIFPIFIIFLSSIMIYFQ